MLAYAELAVTSNFSFLRGASEPEELVVQAKALGLAGFGIADRNSVAGVVRAHVAAQANGWCAGWGSPALPSRGKNSISAIREPGAG